MFLLHIAIEQAANISSESMYLFPISNDFAMRDSSVHPKTI